MYTFEPTSRSIHATVKVVLPVTGLAYVEDDQQATWAITKSMRGAGWEQLRTGQRLALTVEDHPRFSLISNYTPLD